VSVAVAGLIVVRGGHRVLDSVDLAVPGGTLLALVGPNGAGKTTLLRAVAGLQPADGRIALLGADAAGLSRAERARRVAYLAQTRAVAWPIRARELVALGRLPHGGRIDALGDGDRRAVEDALRLTDVAAFAERPLDTLSGGERARVLLARALAQETPVLLVDEPAQALDPQHQLRIMEVLAARARAGTTVVAVLHDLALALRFADLVAVLDQGRAVAAGAPDTVLSEALIARVFGIEVLSGRHRGRGWVLPWSTREPD